MILEQRLITERSLAIWPTLQFHLNDTEVDPKLQLFMSIVAHDLARFYLSGFMRPPVQQVVQVKIAHSREISKDEEEKSKGDKGASLLVIVLDFVVLVLEIFLSAFELRNIWPNNCFGHIALHNRGRGRGRGR